MFDTIGGAAGVEGQQTELHGFGWARFTVGLMGLGALITSIVLIGIPLLYGCYLAWQGIDQAEVYSRTRDPADAIDATTKLMGALRITAVWYMGFFVLYFVAIIGLSILGATLD